MKESLAILKNCFPNGIPTIVIHHIQPTIRFPSAISQPKNTIHMRFTKNENIPFPYTSSFPNGQNAKVANLKSSENLINMISTISQPALRQNLKPVSIWIYNEIDSHRFIFEANAPHLFVLLVRCLIILRLTPC